MFRILLWVLLVALSTVGCMTQSRGRAEAKKAFEQGVKQGQGQPQMVLVVGSVKRSQVPWHDQLTLLRAVNNAEFQGLGTPRQIVLTRLGEANAFRVRDLLNGAVEDPLLQPGDLVEIKP